MKKGFTMIELLAVFTLLGIILVITLPKMTATLKKSDKSSYDNFIKTIELATEAYVTDNRIIIENGSSTSLYLKDIIEGGYLKSSLVNPSTNQKISNAIYTRIIASKDNNGILSYQLIEEDTSTCSITPGKTWTFNYTQNVQNFKVPCNGKYKIELWGAQGGNEGGKGAYTSGIITLPSQTNMYVYVGGTGSVSPAGIAQNTSGGYNGGGSTQGQDCCDRSFGSGGGATDIRLTSGAWNNQKSLASRIMVAAGGGGRFSDGTAVSNGGAGGALTGLNASGDYTDWCIGFGGTQTSGGMIGITSGKYCEEGSNTTYTQPGLITGGFGYGGAHGSQGNNSTGGGSGYYGGSSSGHIASAGGGSSYISGHTGAIAIKSESNISPRNDSKDNLCKIGTNDITCSYHYSNFIFTDTKMIDGNSSMPNKSGSGNSTGNSGNGYAKILI